MSICKGRASGTVTPVLCRCCYDDPGAGCRLQVDQVRSQAVALHRDHGQRQDEQPGMRGDDNVRYARIARAATHPEPAVVSARDDASMAERQGRQRIDAIGQALRGAACAQLPEPAIAVGAQQRARGARSQLRPGRGRGQRPHRPAVRRMRPRGQRQGCARPGHRAAPCDQMQGHAAERHHQRSTRGPSSAPSRPLRPMPNVYQTATKAAETSGHDNA